MHESEAGDSQAGVGVGAQMHLPKWFSWKKTKHFQLVEADLRSPGPKIASGLICFPQEYYSLYSYDVFQICNVKKISLGVSTDGPPSDPTCIFRACLKGFGNGKYKKSFAMRCLQAPDRTLPPFPFILHFLPKFGAARGGRQPSCGGDRSVPGLPRVRLQGPAVPARRLSGVGAGTALSRAPQRPRNIHPRPSCGDAVRKAWAALRRAGGGPPLGSRALCG